MSSVISPTQYILPLSKGSTCRGQSLSRDSCFPLFCKTSSSDSGNNDIPDLKILAQNTVDAYGIKAGNGSALVLKQPEKCIGDVAIGGMQTTNNSSLFSVILCGNRNVKDKVDAGEKPQKPKPAYVCRIMQKDMKDEKNRLETFKNIWPLSYIDPSDLAEVGFFYLQCGDKVQCAFCRGIIVDWAPGDDPLTEHALHFPLCPFLMHRDVGNIPISGKSPLVRQRNDSHPENGRFFRQTSRASGRDVHFSVSQPKFSDMKSSEKRYHTFQNWKYFTVTPDALVRAGFFSTGTTDIVTCFYCGGTLGHWDLGDDPWLEHKKHFPQCEYLKSASYSAVNNSSGVVQCNTSKPMEVSDSCDVSELMKSKLCVEAAKIFSEKLVREALERQISKKHQGFQNLEDLCSTILEIQDEIQKKADGEVESQEITQSRPSDRHMCKICWDREMGIVFLPCGHMVACPECAQSVTICPLCRRTIENTVRAYMS